MTKNCQKLLIDYAKAVPAFPKTVQMLRLHNDYSDFSIVNTHQRHRRRSKYPDHENWMLPLCAYGGVVHNRNGD
ncbi:hypothetical protein MTO96_030309 [Rhipicephalus appendiculatus]